MHRTCIETADAIELTETLQLIARWLADDPECLLGEDPPSRPQAVGIRHRSSAGPARSRDMVGWGLIPTVPRSPA
jgi:hypothetical protein